MTAFEPPDFTYFTGLQFNPEIYENTLTSVAYKLMGALVSIIGSISVILTAPIIQLIASTRVDIFTPQFQHRLSSSGAILLFIDSTLSSLTNAVRTTIFSPDTRVNASGTSAVSTTIGNGIAGGTLLLNNVASELRGSSLKCDSSYAVVPFDFNFFTSTSNPTIQSANIEVSGGGAVSNGGTITVASALTTLGSTTTTISGTTTNLNSTTTNCNTILSIPAAGSLIGTTSGGTMVLFDGDTTNSTGLTTIPSPNPSTAPTGTTIIINFGKAAATNMTLSGIVRDGWFFYLVNQGLATCTVTFSQASIFGPDVARGGVATCSILVGEARYFRCVEFSTNTLSTVAFTNGWFTYSL